MSTKKSAAKKTTRPKPSEEVKNPQLQISGTALPRRTLEEALSVAQKLRDVYAGKSATTEELSQALGFKSINTNFKYILWSASAYGLLTSESENNSKKQYSLSETARRIIAETYPGESQEAKVKAVLTPSLLSQFFSDYNDSPLPSDEHFSNVLENRYKLPRERTSEAIELIRANGTYAEILESRDGQPPVVRLKGVESGPVSSHADEAGEPDKPRADSKSARKGEGASAWEKTCFYITPLGEDGSEERKHADMLLKHLLEPVLKNSGMTVVRADEIAKSGIITSQVLEHIARSKLCIADLSFRNPNAFYELGVRHAFLLPTIQLIHKSDKIPFDVSQGRTIVIDTGDRYTIADRLESARKELAEYVSNAFGETGTEGNPIAVYLPGAKVTLPKA